MAKHKESEHKPVVIPPATTLIGRQNQMISLAMVEAERLIREGKATSQLLTHFLKMGSEREQFELERLKEEVKNLKAKTETLEANKNVDKLYSEAIEAMRKYGGHGGSEDYDEYEEY